MFSFKMNKNKGIYFLIFGTSFIATILIILSASTNYWITARPVRTVNITDNANQLESYGFLKYGLFKGTKILNHGLGDRIYNVNVFTEVKDGLGNFKLWIVIIVSLMISAIWSIISACFSLLNAASNPIETLAGPIGLYLWNSLALFFSVLSVILYAIVFVNELSENLLTKSDLEVYKWSSEGTAKLSFSFYLTVVHSLISICNIIILIISRSQCQPGSHSAVVDNRFDGVLMY